MSHYHAIVWMDHSNARVFHVSPDDVEKIVVNGHRQHLHHRAGAVGDGRAPADIAFFDDIGDALEGAREVLVVGPGSAKLKMLRHALRHLPYLESRIIGVETVDHPSDGQLVAYARQYFRAADRMRPLLPVGDFCCGGNCGG